MQMKWMDQPHVSRPPPRRPRVGGLLARVAQQAEEELLERVGAVAAAAAAAAVDGPQPGVHLLLRDEVQLLERVGALGTGSLHALVLHKYFIAQSLLANMSRQDFFCKAFKASEKRKLSTAL